MWGKQSVRKAVWYLGSRKRLKKRTKGGQRGGALPRVLIASAAPQLVSEIAKPLLKKNLVGEEGEDDETKYTTKRTYDTIESSIAKRNIVPIEIRNGKQMKFTIKRYN